MDNAAWLLQQAFSGSLTMRVATVIVSHAAGQSPLSRMRVNAVTARRSCRPSTTVASSALHTSTTNGLSRFIASGGECIGLVSNVVENPSSPR